MSDLNTTASTTPGHYGAPVTGELTLRELVRALEQRTPVSDVAGLWYRDGTVFRRTAPRPIGALDDGGIRLPARGARALSGYTMLGRQVDVVETSRGCTFDCSFCSIIEMRGRNFPRFPLPRVLEDIADARRRGARTIFFVDDNITIDVPRFESLCKAIVDAGLNDLDYIVQGMTAPAVAEHEFTAGIPVPGTERVRMNLYFFRYSPQPLSRDVEVVIERFQYLP